MMIWIIATLQFNFEDLCTTLVSSASDFTDSGIVSRMNGNSEKELKELQPWMDDDAGEMSTSLSLDDHVSYISVLFWVFLCVSFHFSKNDCFERDR